MVVSILGSVKRRLMLGTQPMDWSLEHWAVMLPQSAIQQLSFYLLHHTRYLLDSMWQSRLPLSLPSNMGFPSFPLVSSMGYSGGRLDSKCVSVFQTWILPQIPLWFHRFIIRYKFPVVIWYLACWSLSLFLIVFEFYSTVWSSFQNIVALHWFCLEWFPSHIPVSELLCCLLRACIISVSSQLLCSFSMQYIFCDPFSGVGCFS